MKAMIVASFTALTSIALVPARATPVPAGFEATGTDRSAIQALLDSYTKAVSSKDQNRFETLLLNKHIPFSDIVSATQSRGRHASIENYESFRRSVFGGPPFTQHFQDVRIEQDGALAQVSLVFVNKAADGESWGWKTMQLLKVGGQWKIASEFFTGHQK